MFITFHLSISFAVDADLRSNVYGTPPWIWFAWYGVRFLRMFWKIAVCNLLLTIQDLFLLPWDIGFSTNEGVHPPAGWCTANM